MRSLKTVLFCVAVLAAVFIVYSRFFSTPDTQSVPAVATESVDTESPAEPVPEEAKTLTATQTSTDNVPADLQANPTASSVDDLDANTATTAAPQPNTDYPELYGYEVGVDEISEEDFHALVDRLKNDPYLMDELLNELRVESDPLRLRRLSALLGETGSADVLPVIEELVYSSALDTRKAALEVLSRVAPKNAQAYDIVNNILGSEADPEVLVSTMDVLARPVTASSEVKAISISQILPLAEHESVSVRRHSISILPRLTNDETLGPVLYNALLDTDASVRKAATFAFGSYPFQPPEAVERLLELAEDANEDKGVRRGAIYALETMAPNEEVVARIREAKMQMRKVQR